MMGIVLNGVRKEDARVVLGDGDVAIAVDDLKALGIRLRGFKEVTVDGEPFASLRSAVPSLRYRFEPSDVTLSIDAPVDAFTGTAVRAPASSRPRDMVDGGARSAFLNYGLRVSDTAQAFGEGGVSIPPGLLYGSVSATREGAVRGLSNLTIDDREGLRRLVVGDAFAAGGGLGGALFIGGLTLERQFGLDPYRRRAPALGYSDAVLTPSTVSIYVNGGLVAQQSLQPGPFNVQDLAVPAGAGNVSYVIRDAFGHERTVGTSFYMPAGVLARGLSEYGYSLGFRREQVGIESWAYGRLVLLGRHRLGITDWLTVGGRVEAEATSLASGEGSAAMGLPLGEIEGAVAASITASGWGGAASLAYAYLGRSVLGSLGVRLASRKYATLSLDPGADRATVEATAALTVPLGRRLALAGRASYSELRDRGPRRTAELTARVRLLRRFDLAVGVSHASQPGSEVTEVNALLTTVLAAGTVGVVSQRAGSRDAETAGEIVRSLADARDFSYDVRASHGARDLVLANAGLQWEHGRYGADYMWLGEGRGTGSMRLAGGMAVIDGSLFFTPPLDQSFAVVDAAEAEEVRAYANNREIGRTRADGKVLVPSLIPYYGNRISIAEVDLPADRFISEAEQVVAPPYRGGVVVRFDSRLLAVRGKISVSRNGRIEVPAYGQLAIASDGRTWPLGEGGEFEIEALAPGRYRAAVEYDRGRCELDVDVPSHIQGIVDLGEKPCVVR